MNASEARPTRQRGWAIGAALLSLVLPVATLVLLQEPTGSFGDPGRLRYYQLTMGALVLGIAFAVGAFVGARASTPAWVRGVSVGLATLGVLISAYMLLTLVGSCGVGVFAGSCNP